MIYSHHYVGIPVQSGVMRMNSHILHSVWKPVMMVLQCCCEADPWVCFHAEIHPDDHHRFLHIPRRYEFRPSMIQAHGEAFVGFIRHTAPVVLSIKASSCSSETLYGGSISSGKSFRSRSRCPFFFTVRFAGRTSSAEGSFLIHRRQPPLHQKGKLTFD